MRHGDTPDPGRHVAPLSDPDRHLIGLTGLRGVAAAWVVAFHAGPAIETWLPATAALHAITSMGYLGVDLFFALSGFVLCHRYSATLGRGWNAREVRAFLLLRLARLYPVHLFTTAAFGLYVAVLANTGSARQWDPLFEARDLVQHLTLVQAWANQPLTWNVPSWSVSLEWLAYLAFPVAAIGVARLASARRSMNWALIAGATLYAPLVAQAGGVIHLPIQTFVAQSSAGSGMVGVNLLRLVAGFGGGCVAFAVARSWQQGRDPSASGPPRWAAATAYLATAGAVIFGGTHGFTEQDDTGWLIAPLLTVCMALVGLSGSAMRGVGSAMMVRAGLMSYSLYMTHWLTLSILGLVPGVRIEAGLAHRLGIASASLAARAAFSTAALAACAGAGYACWWWVEEPARKALRAHLLGAGAALPVEERAHG